MPIAKIQLPDGRIARFEVPDGTTPEQVMAFASQNQQQFAAPEVAPQMPTDDTLSQIPGYDSSPDAAQAPRDFSPSNIAKTVGNEILGAGETALSVGTGLTTGLVGQLAGTVRGFGKEIMSGEFGTPEAADRIEQSAMSGARSLTYEPGTESGQRNVEAFGDVAANLAPLTPMTQELAALGQGIRSAAPISGNAAKATSNFFKNKSPAKQKIIELIEQNSDDVQRAGFTTKTSSSGAISKVKDAAAQRLIKQGFDEGIVSLMQTTSKADRRGMLESLNILKSAIKSKTYSLLNRPGDVAGNMLKDRYDKVAFINKQAGSEINRAARSLKGKPADLSPAYDNFLETLQDAGVSITRGRDGKLRGIYNDSEFASSKASQRILNEYIARSEKGTIDALQAHRLKRVIDGSVEYGKNPTNPILSKADSALKSLRSGINDTLRGMSDDYAKANTKFAGTRQALDVFEKQAGPKFNPRSENAGKQLAKISRDIMSNNQSRVPSMDAINSLQEVAKKYGVKFEDDILKQIAFMDELETSFGSSAKTSFMGQIEKAAGRAITGDKAGLVKDAGGSIVNKVRGINEENLIKALEEMLK